jgi:hypothetical protein
MAPPPFALAAAPVPARSVLASSAALRLGVALGLAAPLWLAVLWALA